MEKSVLYTTIGNNLLKLRKELGMSQREIAEYVDVSRSAYKQYENGSRLIPIPVVDFLAKFYGVTVDDLITDLSNYKLTDEELKMMDTYKTKGNYYITGRGLEKLNDFLRINMKKFRLQKNKTQQQIADFLGVDISTYNKYEKGKRKVEVETIKKLADWYGIKTSDFLPGDH